MNRPIFLVLLLFCFNVHGRNLGQRNVRKHKHHSACSGIGTECQCRRGIHHEERLVCSKENCMQKLPTDEIPRDEAEKVVSILVTRQPNITKIGADDLRPLGNIRDIRIIRCKISVVDSRAFSGLNSVTRLDLHRNKLQHVPPAIQLLQNLRYLNLGGNKIESIPRGAFFANKHLERLILSRNMITSLSVLLPVSLVKLTVSKNQLTSLDVFGETPNLTKLFADGNNLTRFPELPLSLKVVNLCSNLIDQQISLREFTNLTVVNLSNNKRIGDITKSTFADGCSRSSRLSLRRFEASNSRIRSVSSTAFNCQSRLRHIDISRNEIRNYHETWIRGKTKLEGIFLSGNPFIRECDVKASLIKIGGYLSSRRGEGKSSNHSFQNDFKEISCSNAGSTGIPEFTTSKKETPEAMTHSTVTTPMTDRSKIMPISATFTQTTKFLATTPSITTVATKTSSTIAPRTATTTATTTSASSTTTTTSTATNVPSTTTARSTTARSTTARSTTAVLRSSTTVVATKGTTTTSSRTSTSFTTSPTMTTSKKPIVTRPKETFSEITTRSRTILPPIDPVEVDPATTEQLSRIPPTDAVQNIWCQEETGEPCVFPFIYEGEQVNECIKPFWSAAWCAGTSNYDANRDKWGKCVEC